MNTSGNFAWVLKATQTLLVVSLCFLLFAPACAYPNYSYDARLSFNVWKKLAAVNNQTDICVKQHTDVHQLLTSAFIPVCKGAGDMPGLSRLFTSKKVHYDSLHDWGTLTQTLPPTAFQLYTPHVAHPANTSCIRFTECKGAHCKETDPALWNCSRPHHAPPLTSHVLLPEGWYFTCGHHSYSYLPANLSNVDCCLSRMAFNLPSREALTMSPRPWKHRGTRSVLPESCDSDVSPLSKSEYLALGLALITIFALAIDNASTIYHLACSLAKTINHTSDAIFHLNLEQKQIRQAVLVHQSAIDYILLAIHRSCEPIQGLCCFNLTDESTKVQNDIDALQDLVNHIEDTQGRRLWSSFWEWIPSTGLRTAFQIFLLIVLILITGCCFVQCIPSLVATLQCPHRRRQEAPPTPTAIYLAELQVLQNTNYPPDYFDDDFSLPGR